MSIFTRGKPIDLSDHMLTTYQALRITLVVIALLFPWVLWIGGSYISKQRLDLQPSMSDYYHADEASRIEYAEREAAAREGREREKVPLLSGRGAMRNWFVGVLFAISALLAVYKGFRPAEDWALNLAAVFATLVALVPNAWDEPGRPYHRAFAICFFLCIAYVCIFCASATLSLVEQTRRAYYRRLYKFLGVAMAVSPIVAAVLSQFLRRRSSYIFFAEACGVYAFAAYWWIKTREIRETDADRKAASGKLQLPPGTGPSNVVRDVRVIPANQQNVDARTQ